MTTGRPISAFEVTALGGQPAFPADELEAFVSGRRIAVLAYVRSNGRPNQVPIWHTYRDGVFYMTTVTGGPKHRALVNNPNVSITIQDERPPYRAVIIDGHAEATALDPETDPTTTMAIRYFGRVGAAAYDKLTRELYETTGLTLISVTPREIKGFDNTKALSRAERVFVRIREALPVPRRML